MRLLPASRLFMKKSGLNKENAFATFVSDWEILRKANFLTNMQDLSFFEKVNAVAQQIPYGRVTSYRAIARYLGSEGSARMVGWAMNQSHTSTLDIPAHRVVNRIGVLTGKHHFGGPHVMQQLLENEGIKIIDDRIVNFEERFWDPAKEL